MKIDLSNLKELEKKLKTSFSNLELLQEALTHKSYTNENSHISWHHNERLEFLGDAVLELVVTDYLFSEFPKANEGVLTNFRAALVNSHSLSKLANKLEIEKYLLLSKGEKNNNSQRGHNYILADAVEAIIGAIYLDSGYKKAEEFIKNNIISELKEILANESWRDPKSLFQEKAQAEKNITPVYKVIKEWGPDHAKKFISGVYLNNELVAQGEGASKQEAEIDAAKKALEVKRKQGW